MYMFKKKSVPSLSEAVYSGTPTISVVPEGGQTANSVLAQASKFVICGYKNKKQVDFRVLNYNVHMDCIQRNETVTSTMTSLLNEATTASFKIQNSVDTAGVVALSADVHKHVESRRDHSTQYEVAIAKIWEVRVSEAINAKSSDFVTQEIFLEHHLNDPNLTPHQKLKKLNEFYDRVGSHYVSMCRLGGIWVDSKQSSLVEKTRNASIAVTMGLDMSGLPVRFSGINNAGKAKNNQSTHRVRTSVGGKLNAHTASEWMDSFNASNAVESAIPVELEWNHICKLFEESTRAAFDSTMEFFKNIDKITNAEEVQAWLAVRRKLAYCKDSFRIGVYSPVGYGKSSLLHCLGVLMGSKWNISRNPATTSLDHSELSHTSDRTDYEYKDGRTAFIFCDIPGTHVSGGTQSQPPRKDLYIAQQVQAGKYTSAKQMRIENQLVYFWRRVTDALKSGQEPPVDMLLLIQKAPDPPKLGQWSVDRTEWVDAVRDTHKLLRTALSPSFPVVTVITYSDVLFGGEVSAEFREEVIKVCKTEGYILLSSCIEKPDWYSNNAKIFAQLLETIFERLYEAYPHHQNH